jgi:hypothetical protein
MDLRLRSLVKGIEIDRNNSGYMSRGLALTCKVMVCSTVLHVKTKLY